MNQRNSGRKSNMRMVLNYNEMEENKGKEGDILKRCRKEISKTISNN